MSLYKSDNEAQKILVSRLSDIRNTSESDIKSRLHQMYLFSYLQQYGRNSPDPTTLIKWFEREERLGLRGFILSIVDYYSKSFIDWCNNYIQDYSLHDCSNKLKKNYDKNENVEQLFLDYLLRDQPKSKHQQILSNYNQKRSLTKGLIHSLTYHSPKLDSLQRIYYAERKGIASFIKQLGTECPEYIVPYIVNKYTLSYLPT